MPTICSVETRPTCFCYWCTYYSLDSWGTHAFPPFSVIGRALAKVISDQSNSVHYLSSLVQPAMVPMHATVISKFPLPSPCSSGLHTSPSTAKQISSFSPSPAPDPFLSLWESWKGQGFSETVATLVSEGWRGTTKKQYSTYIHQWMLFCSRRQSSPVSPSTPELLEFLGQLFQKGLQYSELNTAKCAVSMYINSYLGEDRWANKELLQRFMRGVFLQCPSLPCYNVTWDVQRVLRYLKEQSPPQALSLIALSRKLGMLLLLLSGHRVQALHLIDLRNITV